MKLNKATIYNSPFLGIYSICLDDYCIVPSTILEKEEKLISKYLDTKIIKTQINACSLIGVYLCSVGNKVAAQKDVLRPKELELLEKEGIKVKLVDEDCNAFGNLISANSNFGIYSPLLRDSTVLELNKFFNIKSEKMNLSGLDLPGSSLYTNDDLFVVSSNITTDEFNFIKDKFKVNGIATTLNYGDVFVANDIIANKKCVLVGNSTSNVELLRLDDLLGDFE
jgi:translation initiation factor 6